MGEANEVMPQAESYPSDEAIMMNSLSPMTTAANLAEGFVGEMSEVSRKIIEGMSVATRNCVGATMLIVSSLNTLVQDHHNNNRGNLRGGKR